MRGECWGNIRPSKKLRFEDGAPIEAQSRSGVEYRLVRSRRARASSGVSATGVAGERRAFLAALARVVVGFASTAVGGSDSPAVARASPITGVSARLAFSLL
jgi:hypothetical protein